MVGHIVLRITVNMMSIVVLVNNVLQQLYIIYPQVTHLAGHTMGTNS
jgi:hypothetical protein